MNAKFVFPALAACGLMLASCSDDTVTPDAVSSTLEAGTWEVTYFWNEGAEETSDFAGYDFTFDNNGEVTASNGTDIVNGAWSAATNGSGDNEDVNLNLNFEADLGSMFVNLNEDWRVVEHTGTKVRLDNVSGGGTGTDFLTFEQQ